MRFSATALLALPLMGVAAEGPFDQYKAQFQNFLSSFGAAAPKTEPEAAADKADTPPPAAAKVEATSKEVPVLTLENWKDTLAGPVKADATKPEEWWVLISGGNKTCFGTRTHHPYIKKISSCSIC